MTSFNLDFGVRIKKNEPDRQKIAGFLLDQTGEEHFRVPLRNCAA